MKFTKIWTVVTQWLLSLTLLLMVLLNISLGLNAGFWLNNYELPIADVIRFLFCAVLLLLSFIPYFKRMLSHEKSRLLYILLSGIGGVYAANICYVYHLHGLAIIFSLVGLLGIFVNSKKAKTI